MMLKVTDRDGAAHEIEGIAGWRVMEIIRDYGQRDPSLGIKAECGGALSCGTCHVYVAEQWLDKIPPKSQEEEDMLLDAAFAVEDNSRLSCQIIMSDQLDGLALTLTPGSEP